MKLWAGRFQKETDTMVNDFNSSITFDARMYEEDIRGSMAHAAMLGRQGIIAPEEAEWLKREAGAKLVTLGPRILRTETAAIASKTIVMALRGEME